MPTSVKQFFDSKVPRVLEKSPESAKEVAAVYLFKITGADGGTWTANLAGSPPTCVTGDSGNAECTIECTDEDFRSMIDGGMGMAMQLFFSGKLKIVGDPTLATKLSQLLELGSRDG